MHLLNKPFLAENSPLSIPPSEKLDFKFAQPGMDLKIP